MVTTVTLREETHRKLSQLKKDFEASSFDELVEKLVEDELETPSVDEMFGSAEVEDKDALRDQKDRADRYEQTS